MRTREVNIKRHQVFVDIDTAMPLGELIRKLKTAQEMAKGKDAIVGVNESLMSMFGPKSLIVQWDEPLPDEPATAVDDDEPDHVGLPLRQQHRALRTRRQRQRVGIRRRLQRRVQGVLVGVRTREIMLRRRMPRVCRHH